MLDTLAPVFDKDAVTVVFSTGENFAPFCSAAILSLLDHASPSRCYDIIVLDTDMKAETRELYQQLLNGRSNISIRFYNVSGILNEYKFEKSSQWTFDCYGRLLIADILADYEKAIYLDSDQILMSDISTLFDIDVSDKCLGAFTHVGIAADLNGYDKTSSSYQYFTDKVHIKKENLLQIFMSSTLLMNLTRMREKYTYMQLLDYAQDNNFRLLDMDVLNSLFQDDVKQLSQAWGWYAATTDEPVGKRFSYAPRELYDEYLESGKNPKIIHFAGVNKPWDVPNRIYADEFWRVFRRTPFYAGYLEKQLFDMKSRLVSLNNIEEYKKQMDELTHSLANKTEQLDALGHAVAELKVLCEMQQKWMDRIRFSWPYRLARKIKNLFR